ncbi:MAG: hypothetical protein IK053_00820, partial [Muribaculaceae bacterium]|nr:hypothetical protein [Muribaculaceae bacterium]
DYMIIHVKPFLNRRAAFPVRATLPPRTHISSRIATQQHLRLCHNHFLVDNYVNCGFLSNFENKKI